MAATLAQIHRYPVKGLPGERLAAVQLTAGQALPYDRRYALAMGSHGDRSGASWISYRELYGLSHEERLAQLGLSFDEATATVTITRAGKPVARGRPDEPLGRSLLDQFFAAFLKGGPRGTPKLVAGQARPEGGAIAFTDSEEPNVSLLNLASIADIERVARQAVDPRRFRGNLWIAGAPAWAERDWLGGGLMLGEAELEVVEEIVRCAATTVNPESAERDLNIPRLLQGGFGHLNCGLYCRVVKDGRIAEGDVLTVRE